MARELFAKRVWDHLQKNHLQKNLTLKEAEDKAQKNSCTLTPFQPAILLS